MNYKKTFGDYEYIELQNKTEDEIMSELNMVLVSNPNYVQRLMYTNLGKDKIDSVVYCLQMGYLSVYRYTFEEPKPPQAEDECYCDRLVNMSCARNKNIYKLYWRAFNFFKNKGYYLSAIPCTTLMALSKTKDFYIEQNYHGESDIEIKDDIIDNYYTLIRCGEIDGDRVLCEVKRCDYLWIFPHIYHKDYDASNVYCYLITATTEFKDINMERLRRASEMVSI